MGIWSVPPNWWWTEQGLEVPTEPKTIYFKKLPTWVKTQPKPSEGMQAYGFHWIKVPSSVVSVSAEWDEAGKYWRAVPRYGDPANRRWLRHWVSVPKEYLSYNSGYFLLPHEGIKNGVLVNKYSGKPITDTYTGPTEVSPTRLVEPTLVSRKMRELEKVKEKARVAAQAVSRVKKEKVTRKKVAKPRPDPSTTLTVARSLPRGRR